MYLHLHNKWSADFSCVRTYVDDILLAGKCQQRIAQVKAKVGEPFQVKDMGELYYFLGVTVKKNFETGRQMLMDI